MYRTFVIAALLAVVAAAPYSYEPQTATTFEGAKYLPPSVPELAPHVEKHFYYVSAHDDVEKEEHKHIVLGHPKKDYRVIFIKSPTTSTKYKYTIDVAPQHEKTAIYVLTKKHQGPTKEDFVLSTSQQTEKPEVYFIKYKNEEEAELAKKEIQGKCREHTTHSILHWLNSIFRLLCFTAEYDKLGGKTLHSKDELAKITSVIGHVDNQNEDGSYGYEHKAL